MVVTGACLVAPSPSGPAGAEVAGGAGHGRDGQGQEPARFGDADLDHAGVLRGRLVRGGREDAGVAPVPRLLGCAAGGGRRRSEGWWAGGGDGEQSGRAHGQPRVPGGGGPGPYPVLVKAAPPPSLL